MTTYKTEEWERMDKYQRAINDIIDKMYKDDVEDGDEFVLRPFEILARLQLKKAVEELRQGKRAIQREALED